MSTQTIKLNLAQRSVLRGVFVTLSGTTDVETEAVLNIAEITEALDLEESDKLLTSMSRANQRDSMLIQRKLREIALEIEAIEATNEVVPPEKYALFDELQEKASNQPVSVSFPELMRTEALPFELDSKALEWLVNILTKFKWNVRIQRDKDGVITEVKRTITPEEAVAVASLIKAVKASAIAGAL